MPDGLAALRALGVKLDTEHGFAFRGIRFAGPSASVAAEFPFASALGVRRTTLHRILMDHAAAAGAALRWGARVESVSSDGLVRVQGEDVRCRWIVGADGGRSPVRRWAGLEARSRESFRYGFRRHYRVRPWTDYMDLHWGDGRQIYITPIGAEEVCVALISRDPHLRLEPALAHFPELACRLRSAPALTAERGAVSATRRLRSVCRGRTALVGDASGSVDAITGEGLCLAFRQAHALIRAIQADDLSLYESAHRAMMRRPAFMAALMLAMENRNRLRARALGALAARPRVFARMLSLHVRPCEALP